MHIGTPPEATATFDTWFTLKYPAEGIADIKALQEAVNKYMESFEWQGIRMMGTGTLTIRPDTICREVRIGKK